MLCLTDLQREAENVFILKTARLTVSVSSHEWLCSSGRRHVKALGGLVLWFSTPQDSDYQSVSNAVGRPAAC